MLVFLVNILSFLSITIVLSFFKNKHVTRKNYILIVCIIIFSAFLMNYADALAGEGILIIFLIAVNLLLSSTSFGYRVLQMLFSFLTMQLLYLIGILLCIVLERYFNLELSADIRNLFAVITLLINVFIYKVIIRRCHLGNLSRRSVPYFIFYSLLLFFDWIISHGYAEYIFVQDEQEQLFVINLAYVFISISFYVELVLVIYFMAMSRIHKHNLQLSSKYLEIQQSYYEYLEKRETDTRKFRHDIRKHLTMIRLLYNEHNYSEIEKYLNELDCAMEHISRNIDVGNEIINAMLNYYENRMSRKAIQLIVEGRFPERVTISAYDLCAIISNLMDNCMEELAGELHSEVTIHFAFDENHLILSCKNPYASDTGKMKVNAKKDSQNHGFGLGIVEDTVAKYQGMTNISRADSSFQITIIIPRTGGTNENSNRR